MQSQSECGNFRNDNCNCPKDGVCHYEEMIAGNFGPEEVRPKRFVNVYWDWINPNKRVISCDYKSYGEAFKEGHRDKLYIETVELTSTK